MAKTVYSQFQLETEIDGQVFETVQVTMNYPLNEIPSASVTLAVGRDVRAVSQQATIHQAANSLRTFLPAKIFLTPIGDIDEGVPWPGGRQMIFDGYLAGLGYRRSNNRLYATANLIHWLSDLGASSALSATSHPSNPLMYHDGATTRLVTKPVEGEPDPSTSEGPPIFLTSHLGAKIVTKTTISQDLWESALKKFFIAITEQNFMAFDEAHRLGINPRTNDGAKAALQKMISDSTARLTLKPTDDTVVNGRIATAIVEGFFSPTPAEYANTTLWHKLMELSASLNFAIVPRVDTALVVPFMPCLREAHTEILLDSHDFLDQSLLIPRPLRAVAIYGGKGLPSDNPPVSAEELATSEFGGKFEPAENKDRKGVVLIRRGPFWLSGIVESDIIVTQSTGVEESAPVNHSGQQSSSPAKGKKDGLTKTEAITKSSRAWARYAQAVYYTEVLRGRVGQFSGKVRFDVAPGSTVRIEAASGKFQVEDQLAESIFACVTGVSMGFNAEGSQAGTGFQLAFIRTEKENESESFSTERHPLYGTAWKGADLVPELVG